MYFTHNIEEIEEETSTFVRAQIYNSVATFGIVFLEKVDKLLIPYLLFFPLL